MPNISSLAGLEGAEKFVVVVGWVGLWNTWVLTKFPNNNYDYEILDYSIADKYVFGLMLIQP